MMKSNPRGFTLVDVLLSLAVIGLLAVVSVPVYQSLQLKNDLNLAESLYVETVREAQALSSAVDSDETWGVYVQSGSITLFQGTDYSTRDPDFDLIYPMSTSITPSGLTEVVFDKLTGEPQAIGSLTLTQPHDSRIITISEKGTLSH